MVEVEAARALGQDTLERARRVVGPDHPTTLRVSPSKPIPKLRRAAK